MKPLLKSALVVTTVIAGLGAAPAVMAQTATPMGGADGMVMDQTGASGQTDMMGGVLTPGQSAMTGQTNMAAMMQMMMRAMMTTGMEMMGQPGAQVGTGMMGQPGVPVQPDMMGQLGAQAGTGMGTGMGMATGMGMGNMGDMARIMAAHTELMQTILNELRAAHPENG
ncbi:MAG: hypothetical protein GXP01_10430 [Alphaproteobacteria bacterium]|nr:hypothetical protein [Alphaproteobacteria bacterium]